MSGSYELQYIYTGKLFRAQYKGHKYDVKLAMTWHHHAKLNINEICHYIAIAKVIKDIKCIIVYNCGAKLRICKPHLGQADLQCPREMA